MAPIGIDLHRGKQKTADDASAVLPENRITCRNQTTGLTYCNLTALHRTTQKAESGIASNKPNAESKTAPQKKKEKMTPA